ncbi:DUF899 domain-containing protein [Mesorhizobium loti]|uniref:DUF899 domain-containing protein n=1 Tax=Mesorhizobium jarvisii TaxID=1777867 RepID=A0A6M7TD32_9HYPH|nr:MULTISPECIES: DUF899 family protein [Mesorhizobium]OBQ75705.1 hypothetical protein A9K72_01055 [Mesorhizobium loti]QKC62934.1 DUF899 domain-containing protein [Mesorhizobium jarvisii]QKD08845.1 DUF899 domain-containing protein [Mesorhizobium loti]RJT33735.1 DUF899 domain-containing protein [Mesorhizobium jarvisii]BCH00552.1 hypothetical protein MesoLj131b_25510 [Mesorhizobium sp. 131-2-5]
MITFPNESAKYRTAREKLLKKEIELRRAMEAVAEARRALPPGGLIRQDYVFDALGADGRPAKTKLSELFAPGKDSLILYQMMFPRHPQETRDVAASGGTAKLARPDQPCPSCTALLDQWDGAVGHLEAAGFNFAVVAKTALENLVTLSRDRGWKNMRLVSSAANSFKRDYNAEDAGGAQIPLLSVFHRDGDAIRHFWSSELGFAPPEPGQDPRAIGTCEILWNLMDFTPEGRPDWNEQLQYGEACCH